MASHVELDGATSARRRRERRLRSVWRHECQSVRMALTAETQQCREGGGRRDELRPTGTDDGQRRVALDCLEAGVAGGGLGAPRCRGSGVPSLALAVLGGGGDGVDASCLPFLVRRAVEDKKKEEEERRQKVLESIEQMLEVAVRHESSSSPVMRRKRKKRRKRRLPRGARIRRCGQGFRSRSPLSGAQCSLWSSTRLTCPASWPVCTRRTAPRSSSFMAVGMCNAFLAGYDAPRVLFPSGVARPRMIGIMADIDQMDSIALFPAVACARLVLLVILPSRCFAFLVGRPAARSASWPVWSRRSSTWRRAVAVHQGRRHFPSFTEGHLHGPDYSAVP